MAIRSFKNEDLFLFYSSGRVPKNSGWVFVKKIALRKLDMLEYASRINDLRAPPSNRLEKLIGDLQGYYSIRINSQWRVIFKWSSEGITDVDIVDYHK